jgi:prepilin-type N-terminal cleavage/methylation domain-containing protein
LLHLKTDSNVKGFTIIELLVVISVLSVLTVAFGSFVLNYITVYTHYQSDALNFTELAQQSQRVATVLRGLTDIVSESSNNLEVYAYFSPNDTYVSEVDYYIGGTGKTLMASVTPMTANPPIGTPITANTKTYTIISNYYQASGVNLFNYYDVTGTLLALPISDEHTIVQIQINLAEPGTYTKSGQTLSTTVSLRNRKTDL